MRISLRQLEVFDAVCRLGSVTAAAQAVNLSQSAASQALAELELALDGALFARIGRRLLLNERGEHLRAQAAELLERASTIEATLRGTTVVAPTLRIAASRTVGGYLLPERLAAYLQAQPDARIELAVMNTEAVVDEVASLRAVAGFVEGSVHRADVVAHRWSDDAMIVVAAPSHPLVAQRPTVKRFAASRWIMRERGSGTREMFEHAAQLAGFVPDVALELGAPQAVVRAVAAGAGLGCMSRLVVGDALRRGDLVELPAPFLDLRRPLMVVLRRGAYVGAGLRALLDALAPGVVPARLRR